MSLTVIKAGILDTIQDAGRTGFQDLGINPGGSMDIFSAQLSNCLLGKDMNSPVIEMHFPAPLICFNEVALISVTGADFTCCINDHAIPLNQPILVNKRAVLKFKKAKKGARCYLALFNNYAFPSWLGSYSTNIKAAAGGLHGAALKKGDIIPFHKIEIFEKHLKNKSFAILPWYAQPPLHYAGHTIEVIKGAEWDWLDEPGKIDFLHNTFTITTVADRMGYRLLGKELNLKEQKQLVSSAVSFGTLQLLPSGQLILLMADHQTTGGYPKVGNVISAHLPLLAQYRSGDTIQFAMVSISAAEKKLWDQVVYLQQIQNASQFKMEKWLH